MVLLIGSEIGRRERKCTDRKRGVGREKSLLPELLDYVAV
jgi:hypothetical protein